MQADMRAARGARIKEMLDNPDIQDALAEVEADLIREWRGARELNERENCWHALNVFDRLKTYLTTYATSDLTALRRAK